MLRNSISARTTTIAVILVLAAVQFVYWRLLVYRESTGGGVSGPPPTIPPPTKTAAGREDVVVETLAGEEPGFQDGPLWQARFSGPNAIQVAADGTIFVADSRNHRVRKISPDGIVSTVAGGGEAGGPGDRADGEAAAARFRYPSGLALRQDGTLYIADTGNHRICRLQGGRVTILAGGSEGKSDGQGTTAAFRFPAALALDGAGGIWVADIGNRAVRRVDDGGTVTTPAAVPETVRVSLGDLLKSPAKVEISAYGTEGNGPAAPSGFFLGTASPSTASPEGLRVLADMRYRVLLAQRAAAPPVLIAGVRTEAKYVAMGSGDGEGNRATFRLPCASAMGPGGVAYVADYEDNRIRRIELPGWMVEGGEPPVRRFRRMRSTGRGRSGSAAF